MLYHLGNYRKYLSLVMTFEPEEIGLSYFVAFTFSLTYFAKTLPPLARTFESEEWYIVTFYT